MKPTVPTTTPCPLSRVASDDWLSIVVATPQSITITSPNDPTMTLFGLEIAMDEASRVRERDRLADALEEPKPLGRVGDAAQVIAKRAPADTLHDIEESPVGQPPEIVNGDDAGMLERGEDARLGPQAPFELGARERVGNLDRDLAVELLVDREIDRAHAAAADLFDHGVAARLELGPASERAQVG